MASDGTITGFSPSPTFRTQDCSAGSDATISGTVTSAAIRIVMKDRGTCRGATFTFTAHIAPDGTVTSFVPDNGSRFATADCKPVSEPTFSGTTITAAIRITMTDRATCTNASGQAVDADRTLTMSVTSRFGSGSSQLRERADFLVRELNRRRGDVLLQVLPL